VHLLLSAPGRFCPLLTAAGIEASRIYGRDGGGRIEPGPGIGAWLVPVRGAVSRPCSHRRPT